MGCPHVPQGAGRSVGLVHKSTGRCREPDWRRWRWAKDAGRRVCSNARRAPDRNEEGQHMGSSSTTCPSRSATPSRRASTLARAGVRSPARWGVRRAASAARLAAAAARATMPPGPLDRPERGVGEVYVSWCPARRWSARSGPSCSAAGPGADRGQTQAHASRRAIRAGLPRDRLRLHLRPAPRGAARALDRRPAPSPQDSPASKPRASGAGTCATWCRSASDPSRPWAVRSPDTGKEI